MSFHIIIPARLNSSRLPGKVLKDLAGKPMIQYVYENAMLCRAASVTIATDNDEIAEVADSFGASVCLTASTHQSGTERICEAVESLEFSSDDVIIGLQADEPLLSSSMVTLLADDLIEHEHIKVASLCSPIQSSEELFNPNVVKVVLNRRHYAIYFSRAPMPWHRDSITSPGEMVVTQQHYRHVGMYGYRVSFLEDYAKWSDSPLESIEQLEQLRIIWNGGRIHMKVYDQNLPLGVDTEDDFKAVLELIKG
ncbi:MAG: 3-deoxy-manno-octulosonate cytidylyltransferase [Coxiellaceae bacterium]|mgnify:CR=1 FL=1|nr:3-deoxy-manno-octulosonate cytidylyltransferase [Coxiellaceae bacterium]|tara:strand:+ start:17173 stop:17928 length:756 start_codon:yes stop_codon:yes gene_type:complete